MGRESEFRQRQFNSFRSNDSTSGNLELSSDDPRSRIGYEPNEPDGSAGVKSHSWYQSAQFPSTMRCVCKIMSDCDVTSGVASPDTRSPYPSSATGAPSDPAAGRRCYDTDCPGPGPGSCPGPGPGARRAPPCCRAEPSSQLALSTEPSADPVPQPNTHHPETPSPFIRNRSRQHCSLERRRNGDPNMEACSGQTSRKL